MARLPMEPAMAAPAVTTGVTLLVVAVLLHTWQPAVVVEVDMVDEELVVMTVAGEEVVTASEEVDAGAADVVTGALVVPAPAATEAQRAWAAGRTWSG
jgi:hypothetical protein